MNLLHLKYAVEVGQTCSLNKAAENLYVSQPNLSRAIRELEESLGISLFKRTSKGAFPTSQGEEFLEYARNILSQIEQVERIYQNGGRAPQQLSVAVPRADYISTAFEHYVASLNRDEPIDLNYRETNSLRAIRNVVESDCRIAIIRYRLEYERYFTTMLYDKGLKFNPLCEFVKRAVMSAQHPLCKKKALKKSMLTGYIELVHGDPYVPSLPIADVRRVELPDKDARSIRIYERSSAFELLYGNTDSFMMVSAMPEQTLKAHGLVQRVVVDNDTVYRDALIYKKEYALQKSDKCFLQAVKQNAESIDGIKTLD